MLIRRRRPDGKRRYVATTGFRCPRKSDFYLLEIKKATNKGEVDGTNVNLNGDYVTEKRNIGRSLSGVCQGFRRERCGETPETATCGLLKLLTNSRPAEISSFSLRNLTNLRLLAPEPHTACQTPTFPSRCINAKSHRSDSQILLFNPRLIRVLTISASGRILLSRVKKYIAPNLNFRNKWSKLD